MSAATGKHIRLNRLIQAETNTCLIVAIDQGMMTLRLDGLEKVRRGDTSIEEIVRVIV